VVPQHFRNRSIGRSQFVGEASLHQVGHAAMGLDDALPADERLAPDGLEAQRGQGQRREA
jgi:hypothetical protein